MEKIFDKMREEINNKIKGLDDPYEIEGIENRIEEEYNQIFIDFLEGLNKKELKSLLIILYHQKNRGEISGYEYSMRYDIIDQYIQGESI